jgi:hypothetical protein
MRDRLAQHFAGARCWVVIYSLDNLVVSGFQVIVEERTDGKRIPIMALGFAAAFHGLSMLDAKSAKTDVQTV